MSEDKGRLFGIGEGRDAARVLSAELLAAFRAYAQTSTEFTARLAGQIINNILLVRTAAFTAEGIIAHEFGVAAGYITVAPLDGTSVTVVSAGPDGSAPAQGTGVTVVLSGQRATVPLASHQVTLYGTEGDRVSYVIGTAVPGPVLG